MSVSTIGVIGAGVMGSGIAQVAATKNINVILLDARTASRFAALSWVAVKTWQKPLHSQPRARSERKSTGRGSTISTRCSPTSKPGRSTAELC
jgi:3-hydroxyacyl-CoA dehydrogenase